MSDTRGDDTGDREWNDPPGVDWESDDANDDRGALHVATEGEMGRGERGPLTPGDVSPEHALFVVLGVVATVLVLLQLVL